MEKYCVSLEWAKKLKEEGITISSEKFWGVSEDGNTLLLLDTETYFYGNIYPAPIAEELLEILPERIDFEEDIFLIKIEKYSKKYRCFHCNNNGLTYNGYFQDNKLTNALSKLAIELKEEGII